MSGRNGWEWLRIITPILVTINLFIVGQIWVQLADLNQKVYAHVTNNDLHIPRAEFVMIQNQIAQMRDEVVRTIRERHRDTGGGQ